MKIKLINRPPCPLGKVLLHFFMKSIIFLFCSISFALAPLNGEAQDAEIIIDTDMSLTIRQAFRLINKQTDYKFIYRHDLIKTAPNIDLKKGVIKAGELLDKCLSPISFTYNFTEGGTIVVKKKLIESVDSGQAVLVNQNVQYQVSGTITDLDGVPLPGANILEKGTTNGTQADFDGNFSISVEDENSVLVISYVGFATKEVSLNGQTNFNIILEESAADLDEVVVVGYGTQEKVNVAGAVAQINGKALQDRPVTNVSEALQGQIPGVTVQPTSGQPGAGFNITIRGASSLNGDGALVIVDGIPGVLNNINPNDIETISILKDGASASIYGSRASEGVILVTTKKGYKNQALTVQYNVNASIKKPTIVPEQMSPLESATFGNFATANAGQGALYPQYVLDALADPNVTAVPNQNNARDFFFTGDFDWVDYFYDQSFQQSHELSIRGGGERNTYRMSVSWLDQNGYFSKYGPDSFDRYSIRANLTNDLIPEKLILTTNLSFTSTDQLQSSLFETLIESVFDNGRNQELFDPNGNYSRYRFQQNTLQLLREAGFDENIDNRFEGRIGLNWNVTEDFTLEGLVGYNVGWAKGTLFGRGYFKNDTDGEIVDPGGVPRWVNQPNRVILNNTYNRFYNTQLIVRYTKSVGEHAFNIMAGTSVEENYSENTSTQRFNILGNELPALSLGDQETSTNSWSAGEWGLLSYFGRFNYNFYNRYIFEATFRRDGSSRFSDLNKWGLFPSTLLAWRLSNEPFMQSQQIFSNIKIRASYGETGNQSGIGLYDHIPVYNISNGGIPFLGGLGQQAWNPRLPSEQRSWETVKSTNIGIDLGFLDHRLTAEFDYYVKKNEDMLIPIEIPSIIGISVPTSNNGQLETKGYEFLVNWKDNVNSIGLNYNIGFNFSDQKDEITSLDQEFANLSSGIRNIQGYPVNAIFAYRTDGLFQTQEEVNNSATLNSNVAPGDIKYVDIDEDGTISQPNDVEYIGSLTPRKLYNINLGAEWKGFDFALFFQGVGKRNYYLNVDAVGPFINPWDNWAFAELHDYWTPDNTEARFPRPYAGNLNFQFSDYWVQDASYIRLKNLQFGYSLSPQVLNKIGFSNARIYFSGENLWEKTDLILFDPEVSNQAGRSYPLNRSYSLGLNFTF
ncbi:TonB-linked outer membrane protein, SusC/RagA family [Arenibacter palladensis]|uniref:TonB-linked outer membrane protein, SusC/RagA family n=2 Tax=Arenibacter palladensis TaxID=237373 RepID=A0A1M4W0W1_9FLAO|nr:TonB-linked outer membrane protein, SusC/RagA family [Arenibacter palladensis]